MKKTFTRLRGEKQLAILTAAAGVFARDGYHDSSIADICKSAGISNGALYKYFRNKEDLFLAIIDHGTELVRGLYARFETTGPVLETLHEIFNGIKKFAREQGFIISIYLDLGTCALNRFAERKSDALEKVGRDFLTDLLANAASRGDIPRDLDLPSAVYFIDNLIILYCYSTVSEHYRRRLLVFMNEMKDVSEKKKIEFMLGSVRKILGIHETTKKVKGERS